MPQYAVERVVRAELVPDLVSYVVDRELGQGQTAAPRDAPRLEAALAERADDGHAATVG